MGFCLAGVARYLLSTVQPASAQGYKTLCMVLIDQFQPTRQVLQVQGPWVWKPNEELQNLAEEVSRLVCLSYLNADGGTVDTVATFVKCLDNSEVLD